SVGKWFFVYFWAGFDQHELTAVNYISIMPYTLVSTLLTRTAVLIPESGLYTYPYK
ncbi:hypothetical protein SAMN05421839_13224, partial [Halolactibacillus halophilus]